MPKAKELAEKFLIKRTPKGAIIRNRMYLFEAIKTHFGIDDDTELSEEEFQELLDQIKQHQPQGGN